MFYKMQKISQLSSHFHNKVFQFYKRSIPSMHNSFLNVGDWWYIVLTILSLGVLGGALFQTAFVIHIYAVLWFFFPATTELVTFSYRPITLHYWIMSISLITCCYSFYLCWRFPREMRLLLLVETGITLTKFLSHLKYQKSYLLLTLGLLFICFYWPCLGLILLWVLPLYLEYFCLNTLVNSNQKKKNYFFGNNFTALMGLEYLNLKQQFLYSLDDTVIQADLDYNIFEQEDNVYPDLDWDFGEDLDDSVFFDEFASDEDFDHSDFEDSTHSFEGVVTGRSIPDLNLKKRILKLRLKSDLPYNFVGKYNNKQLYQYYKNYLLPKRIQEGETQKETVIANLSLYDNTFSDYIPIVTEYEELSDLYVEGASEEDEEDSYGEDSYSDESDIRQDFDYDADLFDESDLEQGTLEIGFGDDFKAPNWYWLFFAYQSLPIWCFANISSCLFLFWFGIPEDWLITTRETNQYILPYWLLIQKLDFITLVNSEWACETLTSPITGQVYARREFFLGPFPFSNSWQILLNTKTDSFWGHPILQDILNTKKAKLYDYPWVKYFPKDFQQFILNKCDLLTPTQKERFWGRIFNQDLSSSMLETALDGKRQKKVELFWQKFQ